MNSSVVGGSSTLEVGELTQCWTSLNSDRVRSGFPDRKEEQAQHWCPLVLVHVSLTEETSLI